LLSSTFFSTVLKIGSLVAELLLKGIDGDTPVFEIHVIPVNLIERGSGELAPRPDLVRARLQRLDLTR